MWHVFNMMLTWIMFFLVLCSLLFCLSQALVLFSFFIQTPQHINNIKVFFCIFSDLTLCESAISRFHILCTYKIFKTCEWELAMIEGLLALSVLLMMMHWNTGAIFLHPEGFCSKVLCCSLECIRKLLAHTTYALVMRGLSDWITMHL